MAPPSSYVQVHDGCLCLLFVASSEPATLAETEDEDGEMTAPHTRRQAVA